MKVQTINSIETSSVCDNKCPYCPAPMQHEYRKTGFMTMETFQRVIHWVRHFVQAGTQQEVNLFGVGEPLLNPLIVEMVSYARQHVPGRIRLHLNTNGNHMTRKFAISLKEAGIDSMDITGHNAKPTARTIRIFEDVGMPYKVSFDPILAPNNWAKQVPWFSPRYPDPFPCPWVGRGQVMVMSDGAITRCCIDAFAKGVMGSIHLDNVDQLEVTPFELCERCHHTLD